MLQIKPVVFTVHAIVTTSDLELNPPEVDFGYCTIYEAIRTQVSLCNHSLLPQEFGFVGLPKVPGMVREGQLGSSRLQPGQQLLQGLGTQHQATSSSPHPMPTCCLHLSPGSACPSPHPHCPLASLSLPLSVPASVSLSLAHCSLGLQALLQEVLLVRPCRAAKTTLGLGRPSPLPGLNPADPTIHSYAHGHRHIHKCAYIHRDTQTHLQACSIQAATLTHAHRQTGSHMQKNKHAGHAHMHIHIHMHKHVHMHAHASPLLTRVHRVHL